ncbi:MAG: NADH-quinone oxidoreductase subunit NuoK [Verrucomicrobiae bacterium]|nr:NADH-quinone oxidoreductase subunit NuoK [Verrucomicrobiae bacterium]
MPPLSFYLFFAAVLFCTGLAGALSRRNAIVVLFSLELMFAACHLNLIAFWRYGPQPELYHGQVFTLFSIAVSGAEAAVGLALILRIFRHYRTVQVTEIRELKG